MMLSTRLRPGESITIADIGTVNFREMNAAVACGSAKLHDGTTVLLELRRMDRVTIIRPNIKIVVQRNDGRSWRVCVDAERDVEITKL